MPTKRDGSATGGRLLPTGTLQPNCGQHSGGAGKVTPIINGTYPLTPEAIRHVGAGYARGTVVITVPQPSIGAFASANTRAPAGRTA
jgi:hypothetical protein